MNKETLVPIILGVALSGLSTLMSFAYGSIDELHDDIKEGRLSYMDKEHIAELIDFVREDAEDIVIEK